MGRYPLKATIGEYMNAIKDYDAPKTLQDREYILNAIERGFTKARESNAELTAIPANWGEREIIAIMFELRSRGLSHASQRQELTVLKGLLRFAGNSILDQMKARTPHVFPKPISDRKPSLTEDHLLKVLRTTEEIEGWRGECMRFMFWTYAHTGLRLNELRMAEYSDLDLKNWTIRVGHPKGERTYGKCRVIPIPEPLKPIVVRFLREREKVLAQHGLLGAKPLVFVESNPEQPIAIPTVKRWANVVRKRSSVEFSVHSLRRTYGQNLLNRGASIETVSIALGHSSTVTTEKHYCRKDADSARLEIVQAYERSATLPRNQSERIDRNKMIAGYA
ncbi:MAG: site-specific integrase [Thermoplasmatota archaeon]